MKAEKPFHPISGYTILLVLLLVTGLAGALGYYIGPEVIAPFSLVFIFLSKGFKIVNPNESRVLTLFGEYAGTIKQNGFFWVNPFLVSKNISLRARNLDTTPIKVNDKLGNPIMIGVVLVWRVEETFKAAFEVDNYETFVKIQSESAMRKLAGVYPYDNFENDAEISLRASSQEVNDELERELMERLAIAGIHVLEARISYLAYAQEIASAMLQRQQATAIVAARAKIVEGAVGMVDTALHQLNDKRLVALDEERKAAMVTNLMVVLCSDRSVHPVVNAGTLHH